MPTSEEDLATTLMRCLSDQDDEDRLRTLGRACLRAADAIAENQRLRAELVELRRRYNDSLQHGIDEARSLAGSLLQASLRGCFKPPDAEPQS